MTLTKADIVKAISQQNKYTKRKSIDVLECMLECIKLSLVSGEDVLISGFGKFCVKAKQERKGRNPATGESIILPPKRIVAFRCSGKLRKKINKQS